MRSSTLAALERLLLPNACVACERLIEASTPNALVCGVCRSRLRRVPTGCQRCQQPEPPIGPCRFCKDWPESLAWARSAVWLGSEARDIAHHLKYGGYRKLGAVMAEVIARTVQRPSADLLIPMPLSRRREAERGYNQAFIIAAELSKRWSIQVDSRVLRRVRETKTQTALTPQARLANVAGAFTARSGSGAGSPILVDDVLTTGATLRTAAEALSQAEWSAARAVTFARALPFEIKALGIS